MTMKCGPHVFLVSFPCSYGGHSFLQLVMVVGVVQCDVARNAWLTGVPVMPTVFVDQQSKLFKACVFESLLSRLQKSFATI